MEEYIGRNALLQEIANLKKSPWYNDDYGFGTKQARHDGVAIVEDLCIKQAPTADVVEVVRCKDCKDYRQNPYSPEEDMMCMCWCDWLPTDPDDFCSYGVRRED